MAAFESVDMLAAALDYAAHGWRVFPQSGKVPMIAGRGGVHAATTDPEQIEKWWKRYPRANIGLACGDAWWAIDVDPKNGGVETMQALTAEHGKLPETITSRTGGGGWHILFKMPAGVRFSNWTGGACTAWPHLGVDIRAAGVPITAPPSLHASGQRYRWVAGHGPDDMPPAEPPLWLLDLATPPPLPPPAAIRDPIDEGWGPRPRYSRRALEDACDRIRFAPDGNQETVLNREAFGMGQLVAGGLMVEDRARSWLVRAGTMMENYDPRKAWTLQKVIRKVEYGIDAGKRRPNVRALAG